MDIKFVGRKWIWWGRLLLGAFSIFVALYAAFETLLPEEPYGDLFGFITLPTFILAFFAFWQAYDAEIDSLSEHQRLVWVRESQKDYRLLPIERRWKVKKEVLNGIFLYVITIGLLMLVVLIFLSVIQGDIDRQIENLSITAIAWPVLVTAFFAPNLIWRWARNLESLSFTKENVLDTPEGDGGI